MKIILFQKYFALDYTLALQYIVFTILQTMQQSTTIKFKLLQLTPCGAVSYLELLVLLQHVLQD